MTDNERIIKELKSAQRKLNKNIDYMSNRIDHLWLTTVEYQKLHSLIDAISNTIDDLDYYIKRWM